MEQRPFNAEPGVVPVNTDLIPRGVVVCAFVLQFRLATSDIKAMGETGRHPEDLLIFFTEINTSPLPKSIGALAKIHDYVEDFTA